MLIGDVAEPQGEAVGPATSEDRLERREKLERLAARTEAQQVELEKIWEAEEAAVAASMKMPCLPSEAAPVANKQAAALRARAKRYGEETPLGSDYHEIARRWAARLSGPTSPGTAGPSRNAGTRIRNLGRRGSRRTSVARRACASRSPGGGSDDPSEPPAALAALTLPESAHAKACCPRGRRHARLTAGEAGTTTAGVGAPAVGISRDPIAREDRSHDCTSGGCCRTSVDGRAHSDAAGLSRHRDDRRRPRSDVGRGLGRRDGRRADSAKPMAAGRANFAVPKPDDAST